MACWHVWDDDIFWQDWKVSYLFFSTHTRPLHERSPFSDPLERCLLTGWSYVMSRLEPTEVKTVCYVCPASPVVLPVLKSWKHLCPSFVLFCPWKFGTLSRSCHLWGAAGEKSFQKIWFMRLKLQQVKLTPWKGSFMAKQWIGIIRVKFMSSFSVYLHCLIHSGEFQRTKRLSQTLPPTFSPSDPTHTLWFRTFSTEQTYLIFVYECRQHWRSTDASTT